jgi:glycosyltransferase involved in cell wall biosynthesis
LTSQQMTTTGAVSRRKGILFIIDDFQGFGGTERHLYTLVKNIRDLYDCHILTFHSTDSFQARIELDAIHLIHLPIGRYYTPSALSKIMKIGDIIRENRIDIVQTFHFKADFLGVFAARFFGIRHVISSRRDMGFKKNWVQRSLCRISNAFVDRFITVSGAVARKIAVDEGIQASRITTIYNGIDAGEYRMGGEDSDEALRKKLSMEHGQFVVGIVGHIRPEKNYMVFFQALNLVRREIDDFKALIVGGDGHGLMHGYMKYSEENGFRDRVVFTDYVDHTKEYIALFDIGCLVSRTEGFSNAILEYMSMGKPVIATAVGGNMEIIEEGTNGFLVPENDHEALADRILVLYRDRERIRRMGENSRKLVETKFTIDRMVRSHLNLYRSIAA